MARKEWEKNNMLSVPLVNWQIQLKVYLIPLRYFELSKISPFSIFRKEAQAGLWDFFGTEES